MPLKRYAIFYHVWSPAGSDIWRLLVDEQLKRIFKSGLSFNADVFCCITGPQHAAIEAMIADCDWVTILKSTPDESNYEGETLSSIYEACNERSDLQAVAYVHTKGIRHMADATPRVFRAVNSWRHFLEWGTIDRWRDAIARLQTVDAAGVNYRDSPWPHFSGNFWWATASYIRTLPGPLSDKNAVANSLGLDAHTEERINYERWIGLKNPRVFSFFDFPFHIPGREWTHGFSLYLDDIYPVYETNGL